MVELWLVIGWEKKIKANFESLKSHAKISCVYKYLKKSFVFLKIYLLFKGG